MKSNTNKLEKVSKKSTPMIIAYFKMPENLRRVAKARAAFLGITFRVYVTNLLIADIQQSGMEKMLITETDAIADPGDA